MKHTAGADGAAVLTLTNLKDKEEQEAAVGEGGLPGVAGACPLPEAVCVGRPHTRTMRAESLT